MTGPSPKVAEPSPRRLVLVGRTGLDARLRLDEQFELVRARSGLEAIGELAADRAPGVKPVVIVGAGAHPATDPETRDMVEAMRLVRPEVRILRAGGATGANGYDGQINPEDTIEAIRRLIRGDAPHAPHAPRATSTPATPIPRTLSLTIFGDLDVSTIQGMPAGR
ncbi:MAG: hypothetical protein ACF8R7_02670, partial [Phycisphaerales bacterium JB039]